MQRTIFFSAITSLALVYSPLQAQQLQQQQIILDEVMTKDDQKKTGVANLSRNQKIALEAWLNNTFVLKQKEKAPAAQLSLSINIDNGQKIELSDNSIWEVAPSDVPTAALWITPIPIKITQSNDPAYPYLLVNINNGISIKVKKAQATPMPAPTMTPAAPQMQGS